MMIGKTGMLRNLAAIGSMLILLASPVVQGSTGDDPARIIDDAVQTLFGEVTERREELNGQPSELFELVDRVASPHFDFNYISKLVLAKSWKKASDVQREGFATSHLNLA